MTDHEEEGDMHNLVSIMAACCFGTLAGRFCEPKSGEMSFRWIITMCKRVDWQKSNVSRRRKTSSSSAIAASALSPNIVSHPIGLINYGAAEIFYRDTTSNWSDRCMKNKALSLELDFVSAHQRDIFPDSVCDATKQFFANLTHNPRYTIGFQHSLTRDQQSFQLIELQPWFWATCLGMTMIPSADTATDGQPMNPPLLMLLHQLPLLLFTTGIGIGKIVPHSLRAKLMDNICWACLQTRPDQTNMRIFANNPFDQSRSMFRHHWHSHIRVQFRRPRWTTIGRDTTRQAWRIALPCHGLTNATDDYERSSSRCDKRLMVASLTC